MGRRLVALFREASELGGLVGRMRLASTTQLTSTEAATLADTPEVLARVQAALDDLRKLMPPASRPQRGGTELSPASSATGSGDVLRRHLDTYLDMMSQRGLFLGDAAATVRRVTEAASSTLDVERVSVWYCDAGKTKIWCADLFERGSGEHSNGTELSASDFAPYFQALGSERTIAAHDAHDDPRTACFSSGYLTPLGIGALLDVPIWLDKRMVGVICHEHVGSSRTWTKDEETFAYLMSSFVALSLERRGAVPEIPRRAHG